MKCLPHKLGILNLLFNPLLLYLPYYYWLFGNTNSIQKYFPKRFLWTWNSFKNLMQFLKRKVKKDFREYFKINPPRSNKIYISCYLGRSQWNYFSWNMHQNYFRWNKYQNFLWRTKVIKEKWGQYFANNHFCTHLCSKKMAV